jgi:transcriptional regulator with XRE-family HTH domain
MQIKKEPSPIDIHVGSRVRLRRTLLGFSQDKLGKSLGLTFQQIQKYERGVNRIGSSRLYSLSQILDVPVSFFFDDIPDEVSDKIHKTTKGQTASFELEKISSKETMKLLSNYYGIDDDSVRKSVFSLIKTLRNNSLGK